MTPATATRFGSFFPALVLLANAGMAGCAEGSPEPRIASSATLAGYAGGYPEELHATAQQFNADEEESRRLTAGFAHYPEALRDRTGAHVVEIVDAATQSGRSRSYVERSRELEGAQAFFDGERDDITRRVAGAAQHAAKQKCNDVDVSGSVAYALKDAVGKQAEKRLRERNEAQLVLDRIHGAIPREDVAALEKQGDEIARASYLVWVELPERRVEVERLLADAEQVDKTADRFVDRERAFQAEKGRSDGDRRASEARVSAMIKSKGAISTERAQAQTLASSMDNRIQTAQREFEESIRDLKTRLRATPQR